MARYTGGMKVGGGYYWNTRSWEVEVVSSEGGRLKAMDGAGYVKVPSPRCSSSSRSSARSSSYSCPSSASRSSPTRSPRRSGAA